jgi:hypothetical protein
MIVCDCSDEYDELLINGMFRNRDYQGLPISGSDAEYRSFELAEIALHNENLIAAIEEDQMSTIREWYGVDLDGYQ